MGQKKTIKRGRKRKDEGHQKDDKKCKQKATKIKKKRKTITQQRKDDKKIGLDLYRQADRQTDGNWRLLLSYCRDHKTSRKYKSG